MIRSAPRAQSGRATHARIHYKAHIAVRGSKRDTREVIEFEMNLGENLTELSNALKNGTYKTQDYYSFEIYDPKYRIIHALHYRDRVVQHCLCDEALALILDKKLVYGNAAYRFRIQCRQRSREP